MKLKYTLLPITCLGLVLFAAARSPARPVEAPSEELLQSLVGTWEGHCRTWFSADKLADESDVRGEFKALLGGRMLRHSYAGKMLGKPRTGEDTLVYNRARERYQSSWFDSFHMNYGILFSEGKATESGFSVTGSYSVGEGKPRWGWRTEYELVEPDLLMITAFNISPEGEEDKATETVYSRLGPEGE